MRSWKSFSKKDRCPICSTFGRKGDAPCGHDGHRTEVNCTKALELGIQKGDIVGNYVAMKEVGGVQQGMFFVHQDHLKHDPNAPKKKQRKAQTREWIYCDKQGRPVVKVRRTDPEKTIRQSRMTSDGHWVSGLGDLTYKDWEVLNYQKAIEAMEQEELIAITEGEPCADLVNSFGLVAITNKGGTSGFQAEQYEFLEGYPHLVFIPDMDKPGIEHMRKIQEVTGPGKWLYPYPESGTWNHLPAAGGADIVDWVEDGATKEQILAAIRTEKDIGNSQAVRQGNLFDQKRGGKGFEKTYIPSSELALTLQIEIVEPCLSGAERKGKISDLANKAGWRNADVRSLLEDLETERDYRAEVAESRDENNELFAAQKKKLDLYSVLPKQLATAIIASAKNGGLDPMMIFQSILAGTGTAMSNRAVRVAKGFIESPILWPIVVAGPGSGKSPALKIGLGPLMDIEESYRLDYEEGKKQLKRLQANWESKSKEEKTEAVGTDEDPEEFKKKNKRRRLTVNGRATPEAVERILGEQPKYSIVLQVFDELLKLSSMDRYTNAKNSYLEMLLELWSGLAVGSSDRVNEENSRFFNRHSLCLCGGVQIARIIQLFDFINDANGMLGRALPHLYQRPKNFGVLSRSNVDINPILDSLYRYFLDAQDRDNPVQLISHFSPESEKLYDEHFKRLSDLIEQYEETNPAISQVYAKMRVNLARLSLVIHGIECAFDRSKSLDIIEIETVKRAVILVDYYIDQIKLIQGLVQRSGNISGTLLKLYKRLQKTGKVTTRDITNTWRNPRDIQGRMNVKKALILMEELDSMGKGYLVDKVLYLDKPNEGGENDGGGSSSPSPIPGNPPNTGIEQQIREQIKEAQLDVSSSAPTRELVSVGTSSSSTQTAPSSKLQAVQQHPSSSPLETSHALPSVVTVLDEPPEKVQQTKAKGFGQPQSKPKDPPPVKDERENPRFDSFKKTGTCYQIVRDYRDRSVLLTDEFVGVEIANEKLGAVPLKLEMVQCVLKSCSPTLGTYRVDDSKYQDPNQEWIALDTCPATREPNPLIDMHQIPLSEISTFVYSDKESDRS